jgi:deoxyribodipyrimidine photolyase-related protein
MESKDRSLWKEEHKQKLVLLFSAMRHFAVELEEKGYEIDYQEVDNFAEGLNDHLATYPSERCLIHEPTDHRIRTMIEKELVSSGKVKTEILSERPLFLVEKKDWEIYLPPGESWKQDEVYRKLRKERRILMEKGRPIGGKWSFDSENRKPPPKGLTFPEPKPFPPDKITLEVMDKVEKEYSDHFGELKNFSWPVTRKDALSALEQFIDDRLATFGDYQDAMMQGHPWMSHSLLSAAINIGLMTPEEVIIKAEQAYLQGKAPLSSVEGFIRQILGWREYIRGVYLR